MKLQINLGIGTVLKGAVPKFWNYMLTTQLMVDSYSTLPWVMWEMVTGVKGIPC